MQLAGQLQDLMRGLLSGDVDGDGVNEFEGFQSLQVGAITSDLGAGTTDLGYTPVAGCEIPGDDAALIGYGNSADIGCADSYSPPFVSAVPASGVSEVAAQDLECMIRAVPNEGCGIEHPLEASLKALSTSSEPWRFLWTDAQGDRENAGFLRDDALLAVLVISDEDDCSQRDIDAARDSSPRFIETSPDKRCALLPETLMPLSRYFHGLRGLKERPSDVVFGAIAGVPEDLVAERGEGVYARALDDARMDIVEAPVAGGIGYACEQENSQGATPARRLVELAAMFGSRGVVQSMCAPSIRASMRAFASAIGDAVNAPDCAGDACPCDAPFSCVDGRCTCSAQVTCPTDACDPIPDDCGGARDCGGCNGTLECAGDGTANVCANTSTCALGHVCATLHTDTMVATSATAWFFVGDLPESGVPDIASRIESGVYSTPAASEGSPNNRVVDLDLTGYDTNITPRAHLAIVIADHDLATTPVRSGDRYYLFPRELSFGGDWVAQEEPFIFLFNSSTRLLPITPDDAATVGHDTENMVMCVDQPCPFTCCEDGTCGGCGVGTIIACDGPEDCPAQQCCLSAGSARCGSDCIDGVLCHSNAHCGTGMCITSINGDYGTCSP
jgi:hypothetical protein